MREYDPRHAARIPLAGEVDRHRSSAPAIDLARVFPFRRKLARPRLRVLCLPYAGGSAALYRPWSELLGPNVEVCPVEIPGRGVRFAEPAVHDMTRLCDTLAAAIDQLGAGVPMALFGHSMGARIAFELARRFEGRLVHLFASGSPAPGARLRMNLPSGDRPTAQLTDVELKQRVRELGGTPAQILDDDALMSRALPIMRADFMLVEQYRVEPQARVSCPITVFSGVDDGGASPLVAALWELRTRASYRLVEIDAGHFFLDSHRDLLIREIARDVASRLA